MGKVQEEIPFCKCPSAITCIKVGGNGKALVACKEVTLFHINQGGVSNSADYETLKSELVIETNLVAKCTICGGRIPLATKLVKFEELFI